MRTIRASRVFMVIIVLLSMGILIGCGGRVYAPKEGSAIWYYHSELPEADKAVEDARNAGKDKKCPEEFKVANDLTEEAYRTYWACHTQEGIAMAKEATAKAKALCPPPPPPPPCPCPPPAPAAKVIDRLTIHVNFDFNKSDIRQADMAELKKASDFVRKYPGAKVKLEGHTDSRGTEEYNQKLSETRAEAVRQYLIKDSASEKAKILATGYGEVKPVAPNTTKDGKDNPEGRAENRRVEVLIMSE